MLYAIWDMVGECWFMADGTIVVYTERSDAAYLCFYSLNKNIRLNGIRYEPRRIEIVEV